MFSGFLSLGQGYQELVAEADQRYRAQEYRTAVTTYKTAFKLNRQKAEDLYNAACSAALAGDDKLAFTWLNLALKNGWANVSHVKTDADLTTLHGSRQWPALLTRMQQELDRREANYDKPLQAQLIGIFNEDQGIRRQFIAAEKEFGLKSRPVDSLGKIMAHRDSLNLRKVTAILDQHGWVGADKVGGQANQTLFLVIQHADLPTQQKYLPMMRAAVKNNAAQPSALALLEDRVRLAEGQRQLYGSQIGHDETTHQYYVLPLDAPAAVDQRRAAVGLGPLAEYVKRWNIVWDAQEYQKLLPELEAKAAHRR